MSLGIPIYFILVKISSTSRTFKAALKSMLATAKKEYSSITSAIWF